MNITDGDLTDVPVSYTHLDVYKRQVSYVRASYPLYK